MLFRQSIYSRVRSHDQYDIKLNDISNFINTISLIESVIAIVTAESAGLFLNFSLLYNTTHRIRMLPTVSSFYYLIFIWLKLSKNKKTSLFAYTKSV